MGNGMVGLRYREGQAELYGPDGATLVKLYDQHVRLADTSSGEYRKRLRLTDTVTALEATSLGFFLGTDQSWIGLYGYNGERQESIEHGFGTIADLHYDDPTKRLVSASTDGYVRVWDYGYQQFARAIDLPVIDAPRTKGYQSGLIRDSLRTYALQTSEIHRRDALIGWGEYGRGPS